MSSTTGSQNLLVNVFRPAYTYNSTTGLFTPTVDLANVAYSGNTIGAFTAAIGDSAGNVYVGSNAGNAFNDIRSCANNVALGYNAGELISNVVNSVYLGSNAGANASNASNVIAIGNSAGGNGTSNIFVGSSTGSTGSNNILLGHGINVGSSNNLLRIGSTIYGNLSNRWIGIGTNTPLDADTRLDVSGDAYVSGILSAGAFDVSSGAISSSNLVVSGYLRNAVVPSQFDISGGNISNSAVHTTTGLVGTYLRNALTPTTYDISGGNISNSGTMTTSNIVGNATASNSLGGITLSNGTTTSTNLLSSGYLRNALTPTTYDISGGNIRNFGTIQTGTGYTLAIDTCDSITGFSNVRTHAGAFVGVNESQYLGNNSEWPLVYSRHFSNGIWTHKAGNTQGSLIFKTFNSTATAERMRLDYNGNVGIGTTAPAYVLDVSSSATNTAILRNNVTQAALLISGHGYNDMSGLQIYHSSNSQGLYANNLVPMDFWTSNTRRMTILSNGRVGIGTSNPGYTLDVCDGTIRAGELRVGSNQVGYGALKIQGGSNENVMLLQDVCTTTFSPANASLAGWLLGSTRTAYGTDPTVLKLFRLNANVTGANPVLAINPTGFVGFGTSNPQSANVEIAQTGTGVTTSLLLYAGLNGSPSSANKSQIIQKIKGSGGGDVSGTIEYTLIGSQYGHSILDANTSPFVRFDGTNDRVGIGTTTPQSALHVRNTVEIGQGRSSDASAVEGVLFIGGNNASGNFRLWNFKVGDTTGSATAYNTHRLRILDSNSERMTIDQAGNVGIATQAPVATLDVSSSGNPGILVQTGGLFLRGRPGWGQLHLYNNAANNALVVEDASSSIVRAVDSFPSNGPTGWRVGTDSNYQSGSAFTITRVNDFGNTQGNVMTLWSNGNVGIGTGTTAPAHKLDVNGTIRGSSNIVAVATASNWVNTNTSTTDTSLTILYTPKQSGTVTLLVEGNVEATFTGGTGIDAIAVALRNNATSLTQYSITWLDNAVSGRDLSQNAFSGGRMATTTVTGQTPINMRIFRVGLADDPVNVRNGYLRVMELSTT